MKDKVSLYSLFWVFIVASVCGWIIEGLYTLIAQGVLINHSAVVIGPFDMAYGICAVLLTALLYRFKDDSNLKLFLIGFIGGSVIEYIMSWGMELVLGFTAWDYSSYFLNINGRICLLFSLFWGILSIVWIKTIYPWLMNLINKINFKWGKRVAIFLVVFLVFDILLTASAVDRARKKAKGVAAQNKYEELLDKTFNRDYLKNMYANNWSD